MTIIVPRTCTALVPGRSNPENSRPLSDFRDESAYVLLGDPGSGKTTAFLTERTELGPETVYVTARNFIALDPKDCPEWHGKTIYIDGLDEVRAGQSDARIPFDVIRGRLNALGKPSFRLSCRTADWLGANDQANLELVSPDGQVTVVNLDPLNDSDISRILDAHPGIDDSREFIMEAREKGVEGLLTNPQSLELLVNLVTDKESWPEGKRETFEGACFQMADEHNEEHRTVEHIGTVEERLDAAGRLSAIQLIADVSGYASRQRQGDGEFPDPERCGHENRDLLRAALTTKLFTVDATGVARPVHRHIAEFIGALHLARIIKDGLPARRVSALMTGEDGLVVTEFRGLSAWLAAVSKPSRKILIDLDPIGVGLYGDIRDFSQEEKLSLLKSLMSQASRLDTYLAPPAFADLASPGMSSAIAGILTESDHSSERQSFAVFLLLVLACGSPMEELSPILLDIVRDGTWRPDVRQSALAAFVNCCRDGRDRTRELRGLLASIQDGTTEDPDDELLGIILSNLYPQDLPPSKIWNHLHDRGNPSFVGSYGLFWRTRLVKESAGEHAAELLAILKERMNDLRPAIVRHRLNELPLELLERVLQSYGDTMDAGVLYDLLNEESNLQTGRGRVWVRDDVHEKIRDWLEQHPDIQKAIILEGLSRCDESERFELDMAAVSRCLYGAELPSDFGLWSLEQAVAMADARPLAAEHLLVRAFVALRDQKLHEGLSTELLRSQTADNDYLKFKLDALQSTATSSLYQEDDQEYREILEDQRREKAEWLDCVRSQKEALSQNSAPPQLLSELADWYLGINLTVSGQSGVKAIEEVLGRDGDLVDAALQGLRRTIDRPDIPDVGEVLEARRDNQMFLISHPVLVGMAEIERIDPETVLQLEDGQLRKAVAFCLSAPDGGNRPNWYRRILEARPEIVADVKFKFGVSELRADQDYVTGLWELVSDRDHAEVARRLSLSLLRVFPTSCLTAQIEALEILLWAAILRADRTSLEDLISKKLSLKSMNVAQQARWLAAGLITASEKYLGLAETFADNSKYRIRHMAALFRTWLIPIDFPVASLLIRLVGGCSDPDDLHAQGYVTPAVENSRLVRDLINRLSGSPDNAASEVLNDLVNDQTLRCWSEVLSRARESQRVISRDTSYRHPTVEQVRHTLDGATPANAGDLAALIVDRLGELTLRIRTANTDDWTQYWNEGQHRKPLKPKYEEACRDALLSDLRQLLPDDVDAQPEGQYAGDRRGDIRVSYDAAFHVPIEVKKSSHPKLWSAIDDQLISYYTSDPKTGGFGIYLVFWFGPDPEFIQVSPDGSRPEDPDKLKEQLQATLSSEKARKISVCVVDVSPSG